MFTRGLFCKSLISEIDFLNKDYYYYYHCVCLYLLHMKARECLITFNGLYYQYCDVLFMTFQNGYKLSSIYRFHGYMLACVLQVFVGTMKITGAILLTTCTGKRIRTLTNVSASSDLHSFIKHFSVLFFQG